MTNSVSGGNSHGSKPPLEAATASGVPKAKAKRRPRPVDAARAKTVSLTYNAERLARPPVRGSLDHPYGWWHTATWHPHGSHINGINNGKSVGHRENHDQSRPDRSRPDRPPRPRRVLFQPHGLHSHCDSESPCDA